MPPKKPKGDTKKGRGSTPTTINTGSGVNPSPTTAIVSPSLSNWNTANGPTGSNPNGNVQPVLRGGAQPMSGWFDNGSTPNSGGIATGMAPGGGGLGARPSLPSPTPTSPAPAAPTPSAPSNPYSSSAGAAGALFGDGGPMYGSTAPAATPPAMPAYVPPTSVSSAPNFTGMATEPPAGTMAVVPGSSSGPASVGLPGMAPNAAPAFAEPVYVPPSAPTNTAPTNTNPSGMTLAGVQSALQWNMAGQALPDPSTPEFRALAARYGYTSWA